jgi:hypothetical protein
MPKLYLEEIFRKSHYKSILNILIEFQNKKFHGKIGIRPLQLRYALEKGYDRESKDPTDKRNNADLEKFFGKRLNDLEKAGLIIPNCITSKNNLSRFLHRLEYQFNAIKGMGKGPNSRYWIKDDFYNKGLRLQNKSALDLFDDNNIFYPIDLDIDKRLKHIIYGISKKMYKYMDHGDQMKIKGCLQNINKEIKEINRVKKVKFDEDFKIRIKNLFKTPTNPKLREFREKYPIKLWAVIQYAYSANEECSKKTFFRALGWIFKVPGENQDYLEKANIVISDKDGSKDLLEFVYGRSRSLTEKEKIEYLIAWSKNLYGEDIGFSLDDILELLEWGWNNRDLYYTYYPLSIAYSSYSEYTEYPIKEYDMLK